MCWLTVLCLTSYPKEKSNWFSRQNKREWRAQKFRALHIWKAACFIIPSSKTLNLIRF